VGSAIISFVVGRTGGEKKTREKSGKTDVKTLTGTHCWGEEWRPFPVYRSAGNVILQGRRKMIQGKRRGGRLQDCIEGDGNKGQATGSKKIAVTEGGKKVDYEKTLKLGEAGERGGGGRVRRETAGSTEEKRWRRCEREA